MSARGKERERERKEKEKEKAEKKQRSIQTETYTKTKTTRDRVGVEVVTVYTMHNIVHSRIAITRESEREERREKKEERRDREKREAFGEREVERGQTETESHAASSKPLACPEHIAIIVCLLLDKSYFYCHHVAAALACRHFRSILFLVVHSLLHGFPPCVFHSVPTFSSFYVNIFKA